MILNPFSQIITSSLPSNLIILIASMVVFIALRQKDTEGQANTFLIMIIFLIVKDILIAVLNVPEINFISDIVWFSFVIFLYTVPFTNLRLLLVLVPVVINLTMVAIYIADVFVGIVPQGQHFVFYFILLLNVAVLIFLGILSKKQNSGLSGRLAERSWLITTIFLSVYTIFILIFDYTNDVFIRFIRPASYLWIIITGLISFDIQDAESIKAVSYYEESIDSLYNLFFMFATTLRQSFSTDDVLRCLNEVMISETGADGGSIYLVDEFEDIIQAKAYQGSFPPPFALPEGLPRKKNRVELYMKHAQFNLGETILGDVAKTGINIFAPDVSQDQRFVVNGEEDFLHLSSFIAVPLMVEDKIIGVAAVSKTQTEQFFTESDFDRSKMLANFGTLAVSSFFSFLAANERSGIEQTADIAAEIQHTIIPKKLPQFSHLQLAAFSTPAHGVSGDYYDIIRPKENKIIGVVGDVAGRGVSAALVMVMIRSILHLVSNTNKDTATILDWINRGITGKIEMDHYATLGIISINVEDGSFEYSNASHQPLLLYRAKSNTIETVDIKSVPIGVERTTKYQSIKQKLDSNDIVIMYTDGIVESMNEQGKQFGRKNLGHVIAKYKDLQSKEIVAKIKQELATFIGSNRQHDDQTVLIFKMK